MISALLAATLAVTPIQQLDSTLNVRPGGRIDIENQNGRVVVQSWDRDQVRIRSSNQDRGRIEIDQDGSDIHVESSWRRGPGTIELQITVPRRFSVGVEGINVAIEVSGIEGDVDAETVAGAVTLTGVTGDIHAETVHGAMVIRDTQGDLEADNANGDISITNHEGELSVEGINGAITMNGLRSGDVQAETVNGGIEYNGELRDNGRYSLSTHNGNLTVFVPTGTNANVSVDTFMGEIQADFPIQMRGAARREQMTFTIGNGGARIDLETFGGQVYLRRPGAR